MLCLGVIYTFPAERIDEARAALVAIEREANKEPGCRTFVVHQSKDDPRVFCLYEQYDDEAAFEAHQATPAFHDHVLGKLRKWAQSRTAVIGHRIAEP